MVFDHGIDLPAFAAYPLVATPEGRALFTEYYGYYAEIARSIDAAVLLDAPTWRANPDWAATLGHDRAALAELIAASVGGGRRRPRRMDREPTVPHRRGGRAPR